jgi:hypothetical protein
MNDSGSQKRINNHHLLKSIQLFNIDGRKRQYRYRILIASAIPLVKKHIMQGVSPETSTGNEGVGLSTINLTSKENIRTLFLKNTPSMQYLKNSGSSSFRGSGHFPPTSSGSRTSHEHPCLF